MTNFTGDGLLITPQDLNSFSPKDEDDDRTFHHDGSSEIELVGGVTDNQRGFYTWDKDASAWHPLFRNADKIDGKEAGDFLLKDGSVGLEGSLDLGTNNLLNASEVQGGTGGIHLNTNHVELHSHSTGSNIRLSDSNGLLLVEAQEGGNFNVPNGIIQEGGERVATRTWTENSADVSNADYADDANTLQGSGPSSFLQVSGDQMEGPIDVGGYDLNDGGTTKYDSSAGEFVQSALAGPAGSLSGYPLPASDLADDYVDSTGDSMSGKLSVNSGGIDVEGSSHHGYTGIRSGSGARNGHLMVDSNGGNLYLNWEDGGDVRVAEGGGVFEYNKEEVATRTWVNNNAGGISAQNFEIVENSSTNSLDFNYTG